MARRKLNQKKRFKIFKKIFMEENKEYWHNVALLEKLWEKIPQCNTNTLNANEVFNIIKKEKIKIDIHSICKFFKITLIKTNGKKFVIFNENNKLIIHYHNESDIFYFLGHVFHNFLDGAYFKYPFKKRTWDLEHREKLAKKFAIRLKLLIAGYELASGLGKYFEAISNFGKHFEIISNFGKHFEAISNFGKHFEIISNFGKHFEIINYTNKRNRLNKIEDVKYNNKFYQAA
ncbi:hypothetical protein ORO79_000701 [Campylobacter coli]|uniref:hypothetical protein n=4 Tax=Campylobacter coli TaxID=195 RepID=UPI000699562F|nr:hypothetical protein [Campylobacter coli]HEG3051508.1 hypothetical protein [Campylobacter jejuni]EAH5117477.1 hypothetical protein [Campylobacter coli]EAI1203482.1 hypothetical protein [Campylobacter coli]EAI3086915.1 hypothetical protein [Campylobacter coli]EAL0283853.1 hypothetical protein [Campylobacter coli]